MANRIEQLFFGYSITHCCLEHKRRIVFVLKKEITEEMEEEGDIPGDDVLPTSVALYNPDIWMEKENFVAVEWNGGIRRAYAEISGKDRSNEIVICGVGGAGQGAEYSFFSDKEWYTKKGPWEDLGFSKIHKAMLAATNIDGDVYFAGRLRKLFKRTAKNQWIDLTDENEHENLFIDLKEAKAQGRKPFTMPMGFHAIDGFSGSDIYCGGHQGDLWHFDGSQWWRLAPPTNFDINSITCAGDGNVYVAGAMGGLIRGRFNPETKEEHWQIIKNDLTGTEASFNSLAWFQGRLYLGHDWALYTLTEADKVEKVVFPKGGVHQYSFQHVTACDTALLSYGPHQAVVFDGEKWEQIVGKIVIPE